MSSYLSEEPLNSIISFFINSFELDLLTINSLLTLFLNLFIKLLKLCVSRKGINLFKSRTGLILKSSISEITGTFFSRVTRDRDSLAWSAYSIRFSLLLFCLISAALNNNSSKFPYSLISSAAVFIPIPGTPGILSLLSPARD